jgi:Family of unknown function (DUF5953)
MLWRPPSLPATGVPWPLSTQWNAECQACAWGGQFPTRGRPSRYRAAAADVLESAGEAAGSYWAHVIPDNVASAIWDQTSHVVGGPSKTPRGLPMLKRPHELRSADIPRRLGWLNYWSAAAAQVIGFPDPARDAELLSRSRRTATGGWVVRLTETPLDLDNPAHLETLIRTYERFPEIGGRVSR